MIHLKNKMEPLHLRQKFRLLVKEKKMLHTCPLTHSLKNMSETRPWNWKTNGIRQNKTQVHVSDFGLVCVYLLLVKVKRESGKVRGGFRGHLWPVPIASQMAFGGSLGPPDIRQRARSSDEETSKEKESSWFNGDSDVNPGWSRALMALRCPLNFS